MAVTDDNIVALFAALLAERRVLLTSRKLSTVRRDRRAGEGPRPGLVPGGGTIGADS